MLYWHLPYCYFRASSIRPIGRAKLLAVWRLWDNVTMKSLSFPILCLLLLNSCSVSYVVKQGVYQFKLLANAEPIEKALRSKDLDLAKRKKLELVLDVRHFAADNLSLETGKNYKDVNLSWHYPIYTVSASYPLQFKPYQWWFPIIGSVPYKGFFDENDAIHEQTALTAQGFDTQKGRIQGYSTLGFFSDPVWPSMLNLDDDDLIELIIHELTHRTVYVPNQTPFNETLANFVGKTGARAYLVSRFGEHSAKVADFDRHLQQKAIFRDFFHRLYRELDQFYTSDLPDEQKKAGKIELLAKAKISYGQLMEDRRVTSIDWSRINNAFLLSFKRYNYDESLFTQLLAKTRGDFTEFFQLVRLCGTHDDPFFELKSMIDTHLGKP